LRNRRGRTARLGRRSHRSDEITGRHRAALGDMDLLNDAAGRRWHIHRCLFGLEGDERRFGLDTLTSLDENVDHSDVLEVTHVGHSYFYEAHSGVHRG
jgi:hypothetical protein